MVKITAVVCAALATLTAARNCTPGLTYCGKTLRAIATGNNYDKQMREAMLKNWGNAHPTNFEMNNYLFACIGGPNGDIQVISSCFGKECIDNGNGKSDTCAR
ncbi:hypothetical protein V8F06_010207 [Rhypophila decipiens]